MRRASSPRRLTTTSPIHDGLARRRQRRLCLRGLRHRGTTRWASDDTTAGWRRKGLSVDGKGSDLGTSRSVRTGRACPGGAASRRMGRRPDAERKAVMAAGKPAGVLVVRSTARMQGTFADNAAQASLAARNVGPGVALPAPSSRPTPSPPNWPTKSWRLAAGRREGLRQQINRQPQARACSRSRARAIETEVEQSRGCGTENVLAS